MEGMGGNTILPHDLSHSLRGDRTSKRRRQLLIRIVRPTQPLNRIVRSELQQQHHKSEHCQEYSQPPAIWPDHGAFLDFDFNIIQFSPGPAPPRAACGTNVTLPTIQSFISFISQREWLPGLHQHCSRPPWPNPPPSCRATPQPCFGQPR